MASNMRTSQAGLDVIKAFEGFRPSYHELPDGRWIIGYGHVRSNREGVRVSQTEAEAILREYDLPPIERLVADTVLAPLNQNEFDALVSFAFNIGARAFLRCDVVTLLNAGNRLSAAAAMDRWRRARIGGRIQIVDALVRRRAAEKALFLKAPGTMPSAPSLLFRPLPDKSVLPAPARREEAKRDRGSVATVAPRKVQAEPAATATEQAAESIRRQMVRILGDEASEPAPLPSTSTTDGASPEEITAAVSELAGGLDESSVRKSVWPQQDDLPPPPHFEDDAPSWPVDARTSSVQIDDLEQVRVTEADIQRAVKEHEAFEAREQSHRRFRATPFGILSLIGAALAGYGAAELFGFFVSEETLKSEMAMYLPPLLILLGGLLFTVMAYHFVKVLFGRD
ncbi:MAG: lysozyme [Henriciella sp.]|nr:lysozyme [Henriciella sp.]